MEFDYYGGCEMDHGYDEGNFAVPKGVRECEKRGCYEWIFPKAQKAGRTLCDGCEEEAECRAKANGER
jgi:hypothetical protein